MASPVPKFPQIIANIKKKGYSLQVGIEIAKTEIMRETGSIKESTLSECLKAMIRLGYFKDTGRGAVLYIRQKEPYDFSQADSKEIKDQLGEKYGV